MENSLTLSDQELREVSGRKQRSKQARWLTQVGIRFLEGGDGRLKVLRSTIEQRLGAAKPKRQPTEPDTEALQAIQNGQTAKIK